MSHTALSGKNVRSFLTFEKVQMIESVSANARVSRGRHIIRKLIAYFSWIFSRFSMTAMHFIISADNDDWQTLLLLWRPPHTEWRSVQNVGGCFWVLNTVQVMHIGKINARSKSMDSSIYSVIFIVCIDYKWQCEDNITQNGGNRVIERGDHIEIVTLVGPISKISLDVCSVYVEKCTIFLVKEYDLIAILLSSFRCLHWPLFVFYCLRFLKIFDIKT